MFNTQRVTSSKSYTSDVVVDPHQWVRVPNPIKKRALLHACDNCGVVLSENTIMKNCKAGPDQQIITKALLVSRP